MIGGAGVFCRRELDEEVVADGVGADTVGGAGAGAVVGLESGMTEGMSNSGGRIYAEWTGKDVEGCVGRCQDLPWVWHGRMS